MGVSSVQSLNSHLHYVLKRMLTSWFLIESQVVMITSKVSMRMKSNQDIVISLPGFRRSCK